MKHLKVADIQTNFLNYIIIYKNLAVYRLTAKKSMKAQRLNNEENERVVVAFQVGSFSKYFHKRRGVLTYLGEFNFRDILYIRYNDIFIKNVNGKKVITDEMGNIISDDDPSGDVGVLNFDEEYDTTL